MNLNPMAINTTGAWQGNYIQPGTENPVRPGVTVTPTQNGNPMNLTFPVEFYLQPPDVQAAFSAACIIVPVIQPPDVQRS